jgi:hypothetical protein
MEPEQHLRALVRVLSEYRYPIGSESDFQAGVESVLQQHEIPFVREWDLGREFGRIDFYLPQFCTGIELKVKGSPSDVARQLYRYCQSPDVAAVVLLTGRHRLARMPASMNGKPLMSVWLSWGQI